VSARSCRERNVGLRSPQGRRALNPGHPFACWLGDRSRDDVARLLSISRRQLDRLASGDRLPSLEVAVAIEELSAAAVPCRVWINR